jgi:hypothetical protein
LPTLVAALGIFVGGLSSTKAVINVYLTGVPDYAWYYGCMGTASGNLMGYWDRHGFPDFYTGPSNGGLAPLSLTGNTGVISLWASKAGLDGRLSNNPGHVDDYYVAFENTGTDPYVTAGRTEHTPDSLCDFLGLSQWKWMNENNECNGNIDGYCFVYWDTNGTRRVNYSPTNSTGAPVVDVQSGLRAWTRYRGYDSSVFSQLTEFNPNKPAGQGFTFDDMKAEIDAGYPVLLSLQQTNAFSRNMGGATNVNPAIHSMLAYGYYINDAGTRYVKYMDSWAGGPNRLSVWGPQIWQASLPVRGVVSYHPLPKIRQFSLTSDGGLSLRWDGPQSDLYDSTAGGIRRVHGYVVEMSPSLEAPVFSEISSVLLTNAFVVSNCPSPAFFRVKLVKP